MIDHISLNVRNLETSRDFYKTMLAPLGYALKLDIPDVAKFGVQGCSIAEGDATRLWLNGGESVVKVHIAFSAPNKAVVGACYTAGLEAGGTDNGAPGPRPNYGPNYYGAFVIDPDGNNIEIIYRSQA